MSITQHTTQALLSKLCRVSIPIVLSQFARVGSSMAGTFMAARLGEQALAASAIGAMVFISLMATAWGVFFSISVLVAQAFGAQNDQEVGQVVRQGCFVAVLISIPIMLLFWYMDKLLLILGQSPDIVRLVGPYLKALTWGVLPGSVYTVLLQYVTGLAHTRLVMVLTFLGLPVTILFTYLLVFGKFGFPALGVAGIGWAITIVFWLSLIGLLVYLLLYRPYRRYQLFEKLFTLDWPLMGRILKLGIPIGALFGVETLAMLVATLLVGHIGSFELAVFRIVTQLAIFMVMIPFGLSQGLTVLVGQAIGAKEYSLVPRYATLGLFVGAASMVLIGLIYISAPGFLLSLFMPRSTLGWMDMLQLAIPLFVVTAFFQLFDSVRFMYSGALRGMKDTGVSMYISILSFWLIGIPLGYLLGFPVGFGAVGIWAGFGAGVLLASSVLYWRFRQVYQKVLMC